METVETSVIIGEPENSRLDEIFGECRGMAILRALGPDKCLGAAREAWDLGIRVVEVTIQSPSDIEALEAVAAAGRERGLPVGAGTVLSRRDVVVAARAGAAFVVSPGLDEEVVRASVSAGLPAIPGVATATEVQAGLRIGSRWLKAFPAARLGADWFRDMLGPFPGVRFVATGGVRATNASGLLAAGASVVAFGSALEDPAQLPALSNLLAAHA